ncbi:hypothetical protein RB195_003474 [Necator americanus]|uniref:Uncharacterized protein n=1 Tax=Necator americanus TaxID=51031 RepID=A0ABR1DQ26_NECAM
MSDWVPRDIWRVTGNRDCQTFSQSSTKKNFDDLRARRERRNLWETIQVGGSGARSDGSEASDYDPLILVVVVVVVTALVLYRHLLYCPEDEDEEIIKNSRANHRFPETGSNDFGISPEKDRATVVQYEYERVHCQFALIVAKNRMGPHGAEFPYETPYNAPPPIRAASTSERRKIDAV